jgi:hypothetical protein
MEFSWPVYFASAPVWLLLPRRHAPGPPRRSQYHRRIAWRSFRPLPRPTTSGLKDIGAGKMASRYGYPVIGKRNDPGGTGSRPTGICRGNNGNLLLATGSWFLDSYANIDIRLPSLPRRIKCCHTRHWVPARGDVPIIYELLTFSNALLGFPRVFVEARDLIQLPARSWAQHSATA